MAVGDTAAPTPEETAGLETLLPLVWAVHESERVPKSGAGHEAAPDWLPNGGQCRIPP